MKCGFCRTVGHNISVCEEGAYLLGVTEYESLGLKELKWIVSHKGLGGLSGKGKSELLRMLGTTPLECPICMKNIRAHNKIETKCGHVFCTGCLTTHLNTKDNCPLCRAVLKETPPPPPQPSPEERRRQHILDTMEYRVISVECACRNLIVVPNNMESREEICRRIVTHIHYYPNTINSEYAMRICAAMWEVKSSNYRKRKRGLPEDIIRPKELVNEFLELMNEAERTTPMYEVSARFTPTYENNTFILTSIDYPTEYIRTEIFF